MKTIKLILQTILISLLILSCTNEGNTPENTEIDIEKGLINSLNKSYDISNRIISKARTNQYSRNDAELKDYIKAEEENIINIVKSEFPEFEFNENLKDDDVTVLLEIENLPNEIDQLDITDIEKDFVKQLYNYTDKEEFDNIGVLIQNFKENLNNNNFTSLDLQRAEFMVNTFDIIYTNYSKDSDSTTASRFSWSSVAKAALAGAMVGAVRGFVNGCITGAFLGFNPGSVAAGCMGGMIVGMVQGAVVGAVGGTVAQAL